MKEPIIKVVNSTAGAADLTEAAGNILFKGEVIANYINIRAGLSSMSQVGIAELPQAIQVTIAATVLNSNTTNGEQKYQVKIVQYNPTTGVATTYTITHITPATGAVSPTTVAAAMATWINGQSFLGYTAVAIGGTITITGKVGAGAFSAYAGLQPTAITINNAWSPYVAAIGNLAQLTKLGAPVAQVSTVSGHYYTIIKIAAYPHLSDNMTLEQKQHQDVYFFLDILMSNYAALLTRFGEVFDSFAAGGSTVDPKFVAKR
jgi:hypothetical protein